MMMLIDVIGGVQTLAEESQKNINDVDSLIKMNTALIIILVGVLIWVFFENRKANKNKFDYIENENKTLSEQIKIIAENNIKMNQILEFHTSELRDVKKSFEKNLDEINDLKLNCAVSGHNNRKAS